jgi:galactokinase
MKRLMLIPLDSRPCCSTFPERIGNIAGCSILKPPEEMLGQFLTPGKCSLLGEWMLQQADYADGFVVSCDILSYGGLVASRDINTSYEVAIERLKVLRKLKE